MSKKRAVITGITGQDGSYLADFLLEKGYEVHGIRRRTSAYNLFNLDHLELDPHKSNNMFLHYGDLSDSSSLNRIIEKIVPHEIYNLGAQSHVHVSFQVPEYTADVDALGTLRLLDAIKERGLTTKFYQASTSELYGDVLETPQKETTPFNPQSPYAIAKLYAHKITMNYRKAYALFACNGILFNHESPRRGPSFVTRKITKAASKISMGLERTLFLGNLDAKRDWGFAGDYVKAMWLMLQNPEPDDYVIATGENHSVREFVEKAFEFAGIDIVWEGSGVNEKGIDKKTNIVRVEIDPYYFRPAEVDELIGDASKAKTILKWEPEVRFEQLIEMMMAHDMNLLANRK